MAYVLVAVPKKMDSRVAKMLATLGMPADFDDNPTLAMELMKLKVVMLKYIESVDDMVSSAPYPIDSPLVESLIDAVWGTGVDTENANVDIPVDDFKVFYDEPVEEVKVTRFYLDFPVTYFAKVFNCKYFDCDPKARKLVYYNAVKNVEGLAPVVEAYLKKIDAYRALVNIKRVVLTKFRTKKFEEFREAVIKKLSQGEDAKAEVSVQGIDLSKIKIKVNVDEVLKYVKD